jgi:chromosomal replication initiator protein
MTAQLTIAAVKGAVAGHFRVPEAALRTKGRAPAVLRSRQIGMYLARRLTTRTNGQIAAQFGLTHPSTVIGAVEWVERLRREDAGADAAVGMLAEVLAGHVGEGAR